MTSIEREEKEKVKKREKKLEDEETLQQATWVKYTIPIKHQVDANSIRTLELPLILNIIFNIIFNSILKNIYK